MSPFKKKKAVEAADSAPADAVPSAEPVKEETKAETKVEVKPSASHANLVQAERELRRYVRRDGGFRVGIPAKDKARAEELLKLLNRTEPAWDRRLDPPSSKDLTS